MRNSIILISPYFGKLPNYFKLFLKSCEFNNTIEWLIFTDENIDFKKDIPNNVHIYYIEFEQLIELIKNKLHLDVKISKPYKLCDFKPAYGIIFEDYIKDFDFWGYCDMDLIFGDIRSFITEEILNQYNKILNRGHLTLYRNNKICNNYFKLSHNEIDYIKIFNNEKIYGFDEWNGIYKLLKYNNIPQYHKEFIADINPKKMRFYMTKLKNYYYQVFYWENGKVYHCYYYKGDVYKEEVCYIHFQKRHFPTIRFDVNKALSFYITPNGFFPKVSEPNIIDFLRYNGYKISQPINFYYELLRKKYIKNMRG